MTDLIDYLSWLYADFPNYADIAMLAFACGIVYTLGVLKLADHATY